MKTSEIISEGIWDTVKSKFTKQPTQQPAPQVEPTMGGQAPAVWKNNRAPAGTAATTSPAAAAQTATTQAAPAVWKSNRALANTPADTSPEAAAQTAAQQTAAPATPAATPAKPQPTYNVPTGGVPSTNSMAPSNATVYPPKTTDTTQAILPQSNPNKQTFSAPTGGSTVPATNMQMPTNMSTTGQPTKPQATPVNPAVSPSYAAPSSNSTTSTTSEPTKPEATPAKPGSTQPTYNVPTGSLPAVSSTMPQNMGTNPNATPAPAAPKTAEPEPAAKAATPATEPVAKEPTAQPAAQPADKAAGNKTSKRGFGGWVKDLFDPNARVANAANKSANAVRAKSIGREVGDFQLGFRGIDPEDREGYQQAFINMAKKRYPSMDDATLQSIAQGVDPGDPSTITQAVGSALNSHMTNLQSHQPTDFSKYLPDQPGANDKAGANAFGNMASQLTKTDNKAIDTSGKTDYGLGKESSGSFIYPGQKFDSQNGEPIDSSKPADQGKEGNWRDFKAEPMKIGGQELDPNNPNDAKIIAQVQQQQNSKQQAGPAGADPETANAQNKAAGLPPMFQKDANGNWEKTDWGNATPDEIEDYHRQNAQDAAAASNKQEVDTTGETDYGLGKQSDGAFIFPGQKVDSQTGEPVNSSKPATQEPAAQQPTPQGTAMPTTPYTVPGAMTPTMNTKQPKQKNSRKKELKAKYKKSQTAQPDSMNNTVASSTGKGFGQAVQAARAKGIATAESKNFAGLVWRKLKEGK